MPPVLDRSKVDPIARFGDKIHYRHFGFVLVWVDRVDVNQPASLPGKVVRESNRPIYVLDLDRCCVAFGVEAVENASRLPGAPR